MESDRPSLQQQGVACKKMVVGWSSILFYSFFEEKRKQGKKWRGARSLFWRLMRARWRETGETGQGSWCACPCGRWARKTAPAEWRKRPPGLNARTFAVSDTCAPVEWTMLAEKVSSVRVAMRKVFLPVDTSCVPSLAPHLSERCAGLPWLMLKPCLQIEPYDRGACIHRVPLVPPHTCTNRHPPHSSGCAVHALRCTHAQKCTCPQRAFSPHHAPMCTGVLRGEQPPPSHSLTHPLSHRAAQ